MKLPDITRLFSGGKRKGSPVAGTVSGGSILFNQAPARTGLEQYLRAYGEDPWLYASVSRTAAAVAETEWHLYQKNKDGTRDEVKGDHEIKELFNNPNPQQTGNDLVELSEKYRLLVGKSYWYYDSKLKEIWEVPPIGMKPQVDNRGNLVSYRYERNGVLVKVFDVDDIIAFIDVDPMNPLDGVGPAQPIGLELDMHSFARQYNRNFFYQGAESGVTIELPDSPPQEDIDRLLEKYQSKHRGYGRAHSVDIITSGGKIQSKPPGQKDMDFVKLLDSIRKVELGSFGLPYTVLGGTEMVQRGNAEAAQFTFARWVIKPRLELRRRRYNQWLKKQGYKDLDLDFDDPTPENKEQVLAEAERLFKASIITRNQALQKAGYDPIDGPDGEERWPMGGGGLGGLPQEPTSIEDHEPKAEKTKSVSNRGLFASDEQKAAYWYKSVMHISKYEAEAIKALNAMWAIQCKEALGKVATALDSQVQLIDKQEAQKQYILAMAPILVDTLTHSINSGRNLVAPASGHKDSPHDTPAIEWLKTRIAWAAEQTSEETAKLLGDELSTGFGLGEGADKLAARVQGVFDDMEKWRAERIARTETMMAANQGALQGYADTGIKQVEFYAALDERVCQNCNDMHGDIEDLGDAENVLPLHPSCLLPDVRVEASHLVSGSRAFYRGKAVEITTENGHVLTCTPNHPILTPAGFVKAVAFTEGDYVISSLDSQRIIESIDPNNNYRPSPIEDVWNTLRMKNGMLLSSMPVTPVDFHGDARGFDGDINIIHPNSLLRNTSYPLCTKHIKEHRLCNRRSNALNLSSGSSPFSLSDRLIPALSSKMGSGSPSLTLLSRHTSHRGNIGLTAIAGSDTAIYQSSTDNTPIYTKLSCKFQLRFAGLIAPDKIIKIRYFNYVGHVYDLQSTEQLYIGNSIVVKNCRCVWLAVVG